MPGFWEIVVILVAGLVFLGPKRMGLLAREIGKVTRQVRRFAFDFQQAINAELDQEDAAKRRKERQLAGPAPADGISEDDVDPHRDDPDFAASSEEDRS